MCNCFTWASIYSLVDASWAILNIDEGGGGAFRAFKFPRKILLQLIYGFFRATPKIFSNDIKINSTNKISPNLNSANEAAAKSSSPPAKLHQQKSSQRFARYFREFGLRLINCANGHSYAQKCFTWDFPSLDKIYLIILHFSVVYCCSREASFVRPEK